MRQENKLVAANDASKRLLPLLLPLSENFFGADHTNITDKATEVVVEPIGWKETGGQMRCHVAKS